MTSKTRTLQDHFSRFLPYGHPSVSKRGFSLGRSRIHEESEVECFGWRYDEPADRAEPASTTDELRQRLTVLEDMVRATYQLVLMMSQSYYSTPEWQAKENRADEDRVTGRSKKFSSVDELIKELNA